MIDGPVTVTTADELEDAIYAEQWREGLIVFRPDGLRLEEDFDELCGVLFSPPQRFGNWVLIVDEAADLQKANSINRQLNRAVRQHSRSVLIIQTTHSLQDWHRASKDLMSQLYCFRMVGRSLQAVVDFCDGDAEFERAIRTLPDHHYIVYNFEAMAGETAWQVCDDPKLWASERLGAAEKEGENAGENSGREGLGRSGGKVRARPGGFGHTPCGVGA